MGFIGLPADKKHETRWSQHGSAVQFTNHYSTCINLFIYKRYKSLMQTICI